YGHTIGHALEALAGYRGLIHGEAVGIGLVQEADLARHLGLCQREVVERIKSLVARAGLPEALPSVSFRSLWAAIQHDEKVAEGTGGGGGAGGEGRVINAAAEKESWGGMVGKPPGEKKTDDFSAEAGKPPFSYPNQET